MNIYYSKLNTAVYLLRRNNWMLDPRLFANIYQAGNLSSPVFLLGNQGGGLTLVSRILRRNRVAFSPTGNFQYWSGADEMQNVFGPYLPAVLTGVKYKAPHHPCLSPPRSWSYACNELYPYYRHTAEHYTEKTGRRLIRLLAYLTGRWSQSVDARFIDKSQVYTVKVSLLDRILRDYSPKFIYISRNPYIECPRAAMGKAGDMRRYSEFMDWDERLELCIQHWKNGIEAIYKDIDKYDVTVKFIKFEDVLRDPVGEISAICDYIDMEFEEQMLPQADHSIPLGSRYRNRWYPLIKEINQQYAGKINRQTIDLIEKRIGNLAVKLNYSIPF